MLDPDADLVQALQAESEDAVTSLIERHGSLLNRVVFRMVRDPHLTADIVQETFVRAWFAARSYKIRPGVKFSTWLTRIAVNLCRDQFRSAHWRNIQRPSDASEDLLSEIPGPVESPIDKIEREERRARLGQAIAALPEQLREALVLAVLEEIPHRVCAEILGISVKAVELRVYRAKQQLRDSMTSADEIRAME